MLHPTTVSQFGVVQYGHWIVKLRDDEFPGMSDINKFSVPSGKSLLGTKLPQYSIEFFDGFFENS